MINGEYKKFQNIVEINAGVAIYLSGLVSNFKDGFEIAKKAINQWNYKKICKSINKVKMENLLKKFIK